MRYLTKEGHIVTAEAYIDLPVIVTSNTAEGSKSETQNFSTQIKFMDASQLEKAGLTIITEDPRPDDRFYFVNEDPVRPGKWVTTPRDLQSLKSAFLAQVRSTANAILSQTDWMVTRSVEVGELDQQTKDYRASVRAYCNDLESAISDAESVEDLQVAMSSSNEWPIQESEVSND